jgi:hypothetical protein
VDQQQRERVGVRGPGVDEVDGLLVDPHEVLIEGVQDRFLRPPVEGRAPVLAQLAEVRLADAVGPAAVRDDVVEEAGAVEAVTEVGERLLRHVDRESCEPLHGSA